MDISGRAIVSRMSQLGELKEYAIACGIQASTISTWKARNSIPKALELYKIAKYKNVSIEWLLTGEERELPPREVMELARRILALPPEYRDMVERQIEGFEGLCLRSQGEETESGSA